MRKVAMMTADLAFIGHIGPEALAAAALAVTLYLVSFTVGAGLVAPIAPLAAQSYGAGNLAMVQRALRTGLWTALLRPFPIVAFASRGEQILLAFGQAQTLRGSLSNICSDWPCGVVPALWLQAIRNFMVAVNRSEPISWITLAAIPLNAVLVYLLVYGKFGLPRLELFGAVLASTLVNCAMFLRFVVCHNASSFP
ncbi:MULTISPECIES: MATE family efflux transporter [unclassified Bradyrhizobium]|uniref:MATE family efflux transporter n=1 Tax=unclassified Bradyrhizobium TaxID=2631580 RepID=UPI001FF98623|nr:MULTISPECIES: MATE family efflux transporter [unclassified Bradyrhizobium]